MAYYCSKCNKVHPNWPSITFAKPEEYLGLTDEEKESKCTILDDGLMIEHANNHTHYYTQIHWPQRIQDSDFFWDFVVWVMVNDINDVVDLKKGYISYLDATLQSNFPWYGNDFQGLPLVVKYNFQKNVTELASIVDQKTLIYKNYANGLSHMDAIDWCHKIIKNGGWKCKK